MCMSVCAIPVDEIGTCIAPKVWSSSRRWMWCRQQVAQWQRWWCLIFVPRDIFVLVIAVAAMAMNEPSLFGPNSKPSMCNLKQNMEADMPQTHAFSHGDLVPMDTVFHPLPGRLSHLVTHFWTSAIVI